MNVNEKTELYVLNIASRLDEPVDALLGLFTQERRRAIMRYRFNTDRNRTIYAELLARCLIARRMDCDARAVTVSRDEDGRPCCETSDIRFSLSHSGPWVACSIGGAANGVDVETGRRAITLDIAKHFFLPEEYVRLKSMHDSGENWKSAFLRFWTLKESCLKCLELKEWRGVDCGALLSGTASVSGRNFCLPDGSVVGVCVKDGALPDHVITPELRELDAAFAAEHNTSAI